MSTHKILLFHINKKVTLNYPKSAFMFFSKGLENEFQTAVVNKPSSVRATELVGSFGLNSPLRQYFNLYRAIFQREGERKKEMTDEKKMSK